MKYREPTVTEVMAVDTAIRKAIAAAVWALRAKVRKAGMPRNAIRGLCWKQDLYLLRLRDHKGDLYAIGATESKPGSVAGAVIEAMTLKPGMKVDAGGALALKESSGEEVPVFFWYCPLETIFAES